MFSNTRSFSLESIRFKLVALYLFNLLDILFTLRLLSTGYFYEANPIMATFIDSPTHLLLIKILLPLFLIVFLSYRLRKAEKHQLIISNKIISGALLAYGFINLMHIFWMIVFL